MNDSSNELAEILDFLAGRARNGQMTLGEVAAWAEVIKESCTIWANVEELAAYYGQSESNIRCQISRRYVGKPRRRVYYSFNQFSKLVPKGWKKGTQ